MSHLRWPRALRASRPRRPPRRALRVRAVGALHRCGSGSSRRRIARARHRARSSRALRALFRDVGPWALSSRVRATLCFAAFASSTSSRARHVPPLRRLPRPPRDRVRRAPVRRAQASTRRERSCPRGRARESRRMKRPEDAVGEKDAILAVHAVSRGELGAAVEHLGRALDGPRAPRVARDLDAVLDSAPEPLSLVKMEEAVPPASAAAHAYALARKGEAEEGLALLLEVAPRCPELPYLTWAVPWTAGDAGALVLARALDERDSSAAPRPRCRRSLPPSPRTTIRAARPLTRSSSSSSACTPCGPTPARSRILRGTLLRRLGQLDLALELAQREVAARPSWHSAAELACTYRARGDLDLAIQRVHARGGDGTRRPPRAPRFRRRPARRRAHRGRARGVRDRPFARSRTRVGAAFAALRRRRRARRSGGEGAARPAWRCSRNGLPAPTSSRAASTSPTLT